MDFAKLDERGQLVLVPSAGEIQKKVVVWDDELQDGVETGEIETVSVSGYNLLGEEILRQYGWKPVVYTDMITAPPGYEVYCEYQDDGNVINQIWKTREIITPPESDLLSIEETIEFVSGVVKGLGYEL